MAAITPEIQSQLERWGDDRGPSIIAAASILMVATTLFVVLRIWAQRLVKSNFDVDDYLIVGALLLCLGLCATTIICVHYGIGQHLVRAVKTDPTPPDKLVNLFKAIWVEGFLWALEIPLVKIAILIFYRRIFTGNQRWFRWAFWIMITYSVLWGIATLIIVLVQCVPVPFFWNRAYLFYELDPPDKGSCLQTRPSQVPSALLNCIGDLMLLLLPFPVLLRLQMNLGRKLELMFIFGLGTFVLGASIVRLRFIWLDENSQDPTWDDAETLVWTPVECCVGVICACIPCMAPLRRLVGGGIARDGYKTTGKARAKEIPLTTSHTWPGEHSMFHSQHSRNDEESGEFGEDGWAAKMDAVTNKIGEPESETQEYAPHYRSVVVNGASADQRGSGISDEVPSNQIKVSKDLTWSEERPKERSLC